MNSYTSEGLWYNIVDQRFMELLEVRGHQIIFKYVDSMKHEVVDKDTWEVCVKGGSLGFVCPKITKMAELLYL